MYEQTIKAIENACLLQNKGFVSIPIPVVADALGALRSAGAYATPEAYWKCCGNTLECSGCGHKTYFDDVNTALKMNQYCSLCGRKMTNAQR